MPAPAAKRTAPGRLRRPVLRLLALVAALWAAVAAGFAAPAWWRLPDLAAWHRIAFEHEFRAGRVDAFAASLELEARLFDELRRRIDEAPGASGREPYDRYAPGSPVARLALESPGNRSSVTVTADARGAVPLLHGLTDAPYSLHAIGAALRERGFNVVALRLAGHGTAPGALVHASWRDWEAAVALAVGHAAALARLRSNPFFAVIVDRLDAAVRADAP